MQDWITAEHFASVLTDAGFTVTEEYGWLIIAKGEDLYPYQLNKDRLIRPKLYRQFVEKYGIPPEKFAPPRDPSKD